jgi:nitrous oxide reductase accessory protein NosL
MLSGIAAFASAERARDFAEELNGQVFSFDELLTYYRENPL